MTENAVRTYEVTPITRTKSCLDSGYMTVSGRIGANNVTKMPKG